MGEDVQRSGDVPQRATTLLLTVVIAVAVIGFFVGVDYGVPRPDAAGPPERTVDVQTEGGTTILPAMSYAEIRVGALGPTRQLRYTWEQLPRASQDLLAEVVLDPDAKRQSLSTRSERRAYNGAPPIIPHAVDQLGNDACLVCHGEGFQIQNRTARQLPHPYYANCMQCHAPPPPDMFSVTSLTTNEFEGIAAPFEGERAWPGAPPVVPHSTWMRDNCLACHGPGGWPGMETTHPWRQNCLQCHAPSSELDLHPSTLNALELLPPLDVVEQ